MFLTIFLTTLILGLLLTLFVKRRKRQQIFKTLGIPGPEPHWWYGNLHQLFSKPNNQHKQMQNWTAEYGKIFGYFEGPTPVLCVSDLDFLQEVFIKKFGMFHGRKLMQVQPDPEKSDVGVHILNSRGDRWKRLRSIINPSFSSAKLKQMFPLVNSKVDTLINLMSEASKEDKAVNVHSLFQGLTFDVMAEAAFGIQMNVQHNMKDPFFLTCRRVFDEVEQNFFIRSLPKYIPEIRFYLWRTFRFIATLGRDVFPAMQIIRKIAEVMEMRSKDPSLCRPDLLQMMLDAEAKSETSDGNLEMSLDKEEEPTGTENPAMRTSRTIAKNQRRLTNDEIKTQSMIFMLAGFETTSTALGLVAYLLATNPEKQRNLHKEIDELLANEEDISYSKVHSMPYLDMVFRETLRMYPIGELVVNRECMQSCTISGIEIPAGMNIQVDHMSVHYDADTWGSTDPQAFEPERFSPEIHDSRHPLAWMPFGAGPRNCIGLRLGMMEFKIVLARVMKKFEFVQSAETEVPLTLAEKGAITPKHGVFVKVVSR